MRTSCVRKFFKFVLLFFFFTRLANSSFTYSTILFSSRLRLLSRECQVRARGRREEREREKKRRRRRRGLPFACQNTSSFRRVINVRRTFSFIFFFYSLILFVFTSSRRRARVWILLCSFCGFFRITFNSRARARPLFVVVITLFPAASSSFIIRNFLWKFFLKNFAILIQKLKKHFCSARNYSWARNTYFRLYIYI